MSKKLSEREILLFSGRLFRPFAEAIDPDSINVVDIAHALAQKCRWNCHTKAFFSVAQHSVLVAQFTVDPASRLWGLLHDSDEAYLPDLPTPFADCFPEIKAAAARIRKAVAIRFGLPEAIPATVKAADRLLLATEARDLMDLHIGEDRLLTKLHGLPPDLAERLFLHEFNRLQKRRVSIQ